MHINDIPTSVIGIDQSLILNFVRDTKDQDNVREPVYKKSF